MILRGFWGSRHERSECQKVIFINFYFMNDLETQKRQVIKEYFDISADLKSKFFFHWAILAGTTLTLIIPLITQVIEVRSSINDTDLLRISIISLMISLILSSFWNLISAVGFAVAGKQNNNQRTILNLNFLSRMQYSVMAIAILSYIFALILLYFFIDHNLLNFHNTTTPKFF